MSTSSTLVKSRCERAPYFFQATLVAHTDKAAVPAAEKVGRVTIPAAARELLWECCQTKGLRAPHVPAPPEVLPSGCLGPLSRIWGPRTSVQALAQPVLLHGTLGKSLNIAKWLIMN